MHVGPDRAIYCDLSKNEYWENVLVTNNKQKDPKIGVFVCRCGGNISDVVDVEKVAAAISPLPNVVLTEEVQFLCSKPSINDMQQEIDDKGLNRVILACCTPKMHQKKFEREFEKSGLKSSMIEIVNIREQDSFVHPDSLMEQLRKRSI